MRLVNFIISPLETVIREIGSNSRRRSGYSGYRKERKCDEGYRGEYKEKEETGKLQREEEKGREKTEKRTRMKMDKWKGEMKSNRRQVECKLRKREEKAE